MALGAIHTDHPGGAAEFAPEEGVAGHPDTADERNDEAGGHAVANAPGREQRSDQRYGAPIC